MSHSVYATKLDSKIPPNTRPILCPPSSANTHMTNNKKVTAGIIRMSRDKISCGTLMGAMMAATPTTAKVLKILEPMTLPAISSSPFLAAMMDDTSSGRLVPTATMVKPMMTSDKPMAVAILTAPHTIMRELKTSTTKPPMSLMAACWMLVSL